MRVGLQLYSVKDNMKKDAIKTMKTVAEVGYKYLETFIWSADRANLGEETSYGLGMNREDAKAFLNDNGIAIVGGHYYYPGDCSYYEKMLDYYAYLGGTRFGSGGDFYPGGLDELKRKMDLMVKDAELAKSYGMQYYYHNHYWEFQKFDGKYVWDIMRETLPEDLVKFELDNYWACRGGVDPIEVAERTGNRLILMHQKDFNKNAGYPVSLLEYAIDPDAPMTPEQHRANRKVTDFAEVGTGILPIQDFINAGNKVGVEYILLEQDLTAIDELDSIRISMDAFHKYEGLEWD